MYLRPSASIEPQDGVGGCTLNPRKLSPDSKIMTLPMSSVTSTITEFMTLGRMCRHSITGSGVPLTLADFTKSRSRSRMVSVRTTLA